MLTTEIKERIASVITSAFPEVMIIYLFGSQSSGTTTKESDYDLAILLPHSPVVDSHKVFELKLELSVDLNSDVDLIVLNEATLVMRFEVISTGEVIYSKNEQAVGEYEMLVLSMYQRFNVERGPILEEIRLSGKVYK